MDSEQVNSTEADGASKIPVNDGASITISKKALKRAAFTGFGILGVISIIVVSLVFANAVKPSKLVEAVDACSLKVNSDVTLDADGKSLFVNGLGNKGSGLGQESLGCLIYTLELPKSVIERMSATTALMGLQSANFEDMNIEWTYHPDNGLDISFTY